MNNICVIQGVTTGGSVIIIFCPCFLPSERSHGGPVDLSPGFDSVDTPLPLFHWCLSLFVLHCQHLSALMLSSLPTLWCPSGCLLLPWCYLAHGKHWSLCPAGSSTQLCCGGGGNTLGSDRHQVPHREGGHAQGLHPGPVPVPVRGPSHRLPRHHLETLTVNTPLAFYSLNLLISYLIFPTISQRSKGSEGFYLSSLVQYEKQNGVLPASISCICQKNAYSLENTVEKKLHSFPLSHESVAGSIFQFIICISSVLFLMPSEVSCKTLEGLEGLKKLVYQVAVSMKDNSSTSACGSKLLGRLVRQQTPHALKETVGSWNNWSKN